MGSDGPDITALLKSFQAYWSSNIGDTSMKYKYHECDAQFTLLSYMNKAFNGSVSVIMQFATGTGRVDICAVTQSRKYPIELKLNYSRGYTERLAVEQLLGYMDTCLADEGWLVVFNRRRAFFNFWKRKLTWKTLELPEGRKVHVIGC
jgi:hypothetical protein